VHETGNTFKVVTNQDKLKGLYAFFLLQKVMVLMSPPGPMPFALPFDDAQSCRNKARCLPFHCLYLRLPLIPKRSILA